jgi:hypothetical protein
VFGTVADVHIVCQEFVQVLCGGHGERLPASDRRALAAFRGQPGAAAGTPAASLAEAASALDPALVVVSVTSADRLAPLAREVSDLARSHPVAVGGAGVAELELPDGDVLVLSEDPVTEADRVSRKLGP